MNQVFSECLRKYALVFFDDILGYNKTWEEHLLHLDKVFTLLRGNSLFSKISKCQFGQLQIEYLGLIISQEGVSADRLKIENMKSWPTPKTVKQLRGFLGLMGYYKKFMKRYGLIGKPLTSLLKKDQFQWGEETEQAFTDLKQAMITSLVLALPDFTQPFVLETDASGVGIKR